MNREEILKNVKKKLTKSYVDNMAVPAMKNGTHTQKIYRDCTLYWFCCAGI